MVSERIQAWRSRGAEGVLLSHAAASLQRNPSTSDSIWHASNPDTAHSSHRDRSRLVSPSFFASRHYYSGPGGELSNLRLFSGSSNPELAAEIGHYLGVNVNAATVGKYSDGETQIQVHDNVRQTHCFIVQPVSSPVNDSLMELLLLISTLRRASAAEITAVIPYYGYERADRKLSSRTPISAADVAIMSVRTTDSERHASRARRASMATLALQTSQSLGGS